MFRTTLAVAVTTASLALATNAHALVSFNGTSLDGTNIATEGIRLKSGEGFSAISRSGAPVARADRSQYPNDVRLPGQKGVDTGVAGANDTHVGCC